MSDPSIIQCVVGKEFPKKVIPFIENSKDCIKIVVFDWRWYPNDPGNPVSLFNQAVIRAKRRGVKIQVITNIKDVVDILKAEGIEAKRLATPNLIHSKLMIIDDEIMIIGSHNYTQSAFTLNHEISTIVYGLKNINDFIIYFHNLFNNYGELS